MTKLTIDIAKQMINSGIESLKSFAIENYPELDDTKYFGYRIVSDPNGIACASQACIVSSNPDMLWVTEQLAQAVIALSILTQKASKLNPTDVFPTSCIARSGDGCRVYPVSTGNFPLTFTSSEVAQQFMKEHKELLSKAFIIL